MGRKSTKPEKIMDFIRRFEERNGYPPSIRDIARGCNISSTSVVKYNLNILQNCGYIRCHGEVARGIEVIDRDSYNGCKREIPVIGQIAAGKPIPVPESGTWDTVNVAEKIELTEDIVRGREGLYALKVKGWSMVDALVSDGDMVLMEYVNSVDNGEVAAIWLREEKEATLKKFYVEGDRIRLQPANQMMEPIYVNPDNVEIQGRVIAVIRRIGS